MGTPFCICKGTPFYGCYYIIVLYFRCGNNTSGGRALKKNTREGVFISRGTGIRTQNKSTPWTRVAVALCPVNNLGRDYLVLDIAFIHFAQAKTLLPFKGSASFGDFISFGMSTHCRFGYFRFFVVGLYLPRSLRNFQTIVDVFSQIVQVFAIDKNLYFVIYS